MFYLRQSTASQELLLGPFLDDTDGKTAETALTIANTDIKIWKHGATSEASKNSGGATHIASGRYYTVFDATDTDTLGNFEANVHVAGALPVKVRAIVLPANVYDSIVLGTDKLDVNAAEVGGTSQTGADLSAAIDALPTAAENADAVWDEARAGHTTAGTFGGDAVDAPANFDQLAIDASGNLTGSVASVVAGVDLSAGAVDAIWDEAQSGHATAGTFGKYLDAAVSGVSTGGVSAADIADAVWDEALSGHATAGSAGKAVSDTLGAVDTEVAAIKAKTDLIPADPATETTLATLATAAALATVDGNVDAILADTGTDIPATLATIAGYVDTEVAAIKAKTDNLPASPAATGDIPSAASIASTVLTTQMTESYAADGTAPTLAQALFLIQQMLAEKSVSGVTLTVKKLDGSTTAATFTLDDSAAPTSITRAS